MFLKLSLFLNVFLLILTVFLCQRINNLQKGQKETETILGIRTRARTRELKELAERLDQKARQRTKDLQGKIEELERFQKIAVGRELTMVELKKEIEKLKKELGGEGHRARSKKLCSRQRPKIKNNFKRKNKIYD